MGNAALVAVGSGGLSGAAVLAALSGAPVGILLVYLAPLPLLMVGLGLGAGAFGFAAAAGLSVALIFGGYAGAGLYGGMHVIPSWLIVQQALRPRLTSADGWQPIGTVLASLTLLVAFVVLATAWSSRSDVGLEASIGAMLSAAIDGTLTSMDENARHLLVRELAPLFLGFSAVSWLAMLVINAALAQSLLVARDWNLRPRPNWSDIRVPSWLEWVLVGSAATALVAGGDLAFLARNIAVVLLTPYFFVGLACAHVIARRTPMPVLALGCFYVVLLVVFVVVAGLVAMLGVIDQWIGVRHRLASATPPERKE
ncbi:MAG: DUF2232 domain-containing protein [Rhodospirillales bacterium]|nr:DUF2232 domain-containing protein [Rhodospirillales bacterium]